MSISHRSRTPFVDQPAQGVQVVLRLRRSFIGRPRCHLLGSVGIEGTSLQLQQHGSVGQRHDRMPGAGRQFDTGRDIVAKPLGTERDDVRRVASIVEDYQAKHSP